MVEPKEETHDGTGEGRTALVAGATGLVGGFLLDRLLADDGYAEVRALLRRSLDRDDAGLTQLVVDFDQLEESVGHFGVGYFGVDDVFCSLGTTIRKAGSKDAFRKVDHDYVVSLARLARRAGARRFLLVSSVGADPDSGNFYLSVKGEVEEAVAACGFDAVHVFQPSFLMGPRQESRPGERLGIAVARVVSPLLRGPLRKYHPVHADALAAAMVRAALTGEDGHHVHRFESIRRLTPRP